MSYHHKGAEATAVLPATRRLLRSKLCVGSFHWIKNVSTPAPQQSKKSASPGRGSSIFLVEGFCVCFHQSLLTTVDHVMYGVGGSV